MNSTSSLTNPNGRLATHRSVRERGAAMVEYALLVALIAIVAIAAIRLLGAAVSDSIECSARNIAADEVVDPSCS